MNLKKTYSESFHEIDYDYDTYFISIECHVALDRNPSPWYNILHAYD